MTFYNSHTRNMVEHDTWEKDHVPWATCMSYSPNMWDFSSEARCIMHEWAEECLTGKFHFSLSIGYFELEEDHTLFILRWF